MNDSIASAARFAAAAAGGDPAAAAAFAQLGSDPSPGPDSGKGAAGKGKAASKGKSSGKHGKIQDEPQPTRQEGELASLLSAGGPIAVAIVFHGDNRWASDRAAIDADIEGPLSAQCRRAYREGALELLAAAAARAEREAAEAAADAEGAVGKGGKKTKGGAKDKQSKKRSKDKSKAAKGKAGKGNATEDATIAGPDAAWVNECKSILSLRSWAEALDTGARAGGCVLESSDLAAMQHLYSLPRLVAMRLATASAGESSGRNAAVLAAGWLPGHRPVSAAANAKALLSRRVSVAAMCARAVSAGARGAMQTESGESGPVDPLSLGNKLQAAVLGAVLLPLLLASPGAAAVHAAAQLSSWGVGAALADALSMLACPPCLRSADNPKCDEQEHLGQNALPVVILRPWARMSAARAQGGGTVSRTTEGRPDEAGDVGASVSCLAILPSDPIAGVAASLVDVRVDAANCLAAICASDGALRFAAQAAARPHSVDDDA